MSFGSFNFGQPQQAPAFGASSAPSLFGAAPSTPFGGQPASAPFGQTSGGMFGATATPAFGQPSTPAFGTPASTPAFGSTGFGAAPTSFGFGASPAFGQSAPAFGSQSTPAFGAQSSAAFGAQPAPAFGASFGGGGGAGAFGGGGAFGAKPAFGAPSSPAFGATATSPPAFGQSPAGFGAATQPFGQTGFGQQQQPASGTRTVPWRKTAAASDSAGSKSDGNYFSITAMQEYSSKSFEELRWEDYQAGVKGNTGASPTSGAFGQSSGGFGAQSPQPFGTPASGFGAASAPAFGQSPAPAFGASQTPSFGSTGFGSGTPAFGGATPAFGGTAPAFGQSSAPAFGQTPGFGASAPAFGGGFGTAQSSAAFGTAPSNPFGGQSQAAPAFGASGGFTGFGTPQSSPGFGTPQSTPAFGSSGFGSFGQSSGTPAFGGASTPAFGQQQSTPAFSFNTGGGFGTPQQSTAFGASSPATGFGASAPSFGGLFNTNSQQQQQKPGGFGSSFGTFGPTSGAGGFGAASAPAFGQSQAGGLFAPQSSPGFGSFSQPVQGFGTPGFGQPAQQQQQSQHQAPSQQQLLVADPNLNPYGAMPEPPRIPEYATGLAARPGLGTSLSRSSPLLAPRPISRIMTGSTFGKPPARSRSRSATPAQAEAPSADQAAPSTALVLTPRSNPRHLFVRNQLPSTQASSSDTASPASVAGGKASQDQADEPSSSKQPGPASHTADAEGRCQGPSHSPGRDEMAEEEEEDDQQQLSDAQIQQLLPKLEGTEFSISPTPAQLAMLVRSGGSSELKRVANFSVTHKGWGSVRWLEPVDVKSLPLKDIVQIAHKNVDVYPANGPTKPDMGEGLNKPAEISLYKIVKRDAKGHVIKQGEEFQKFVQKLKLMASRQSTEFISYDEEREIWKFRVEHFSRYGLFDSDDDEEDGHVEPMQESTPPQPPKDFKGKAAQAAPPKQGYGLFDEDEDMDDDLGSDQTGRVNLDDEDDDDADADRDPEMTSQPMTSGDSMLEDDDVPSSTPRRPHRSPELALALSSGYQHDPQELLDMQQALFAGADEQAPLPGGKRKSKSVDTAPFVGPATFAEGRAPNAWKRPQPALQPPAPVLQGEPLGSLSDASALAITPASPSAGPMAADTAETSGAAASGCLVDAGFMLGQACRACWATNGTLIIPGKGLSQSAITFKHIAHLPTPVFPKVDTKASSKDQRFQLKQQQDQQRSNIQQALQLHLDNSSADTPATAGSLTTSRMVPDPEEMDDEEESLPSTSGSAQQPEDRSVPRWRLRCKQEAELESLSKKLADLSTSMLDNAAKVQKTVLQQQICTWTLLSVLYTAIEDAPVFNLPDKPSLPEMLRRECLSHWLKEQAAAGMERANPRHSLSGLAHVAQLLSGHQTAAATVMSASMGDVRLATMVAQAGASTSGRQLIEQQLNTWQSETWEGETYAHHIDQDRLLIYRILAGQVQQVIPQLDLDWRRALGLHFWYHQPPTASISDLLDSYSASVSEDTDDVPQPQPLYQEAGGVEPPRSSNAASATDFQLLRLAAGDLPGAQPDDGMAELLRPAGVTPDPLDHSFAWQLLSVLQAIGAFTVEDDDGCPPPQVFHLHMSLISQLEALGDMPHWAVYVALHLPNHPSLGGPLLREGVVKELLMRHAPEWAADASKQDFLLHKLEVPPAWLDQSLAQWSQYRQDDSGRLQHLLEAELWAEAHQLLCFHLAPQLFFASHSQEGSIPSQQQQDLEDHLRQLIARLESHAQETGVQSNLQTSAELHAVSWSDGAGLYALYYELRDAFRSSSGYASGQQQRMHDYLQFTQQLEHVATIWSVGSGSTLRQVVLSMLSGCVTHWLLKDASPVLHRQPEEVGLMGYDTSSNMLNVQLAASWLAQRAG